MNLLWLPNNSPSVPDSTDRGIRSTQAGASMGKAISASTQDLAWQQAMEHAQQGDFPDWFKAFLPNDPTVLHNNQGTVGILLASPFSAHLESLSSGASTQLTASEPAALSRNSGHGVVSGNGSAREADFRATPLGDNEKSSVNNHRIFLTDASLNSDLRSTDDSLVQLSSSSLAEAVSIKLGLAVLPVSSPDYLDSMSAGSSLFALPVGTLSEQDANTAYSFDEPVLKDDAEAGPQHLSKSQSTEGTTTSPAGSDPSRESIRLYSEWTNQGVRIWLGADGNHDLPLTQLAQHLQQWLAGKGERLVTLVCNGRLLWQMEDAGMQASGSPPETLLSSVDSPVVSHQPASEFSKLNLLSTSSQRNQEIPWQSAQ